MGNKKLSDKEKDYLYLAIVRVLHEAALNNKVLTYTELVEQLPSDLIKDVRDPVLSELLHKVADFSKREYGGVLLSALVINDFLKRPGEGFYWSAGKLGFKINANSSNADKKKFWQAQRDACFTKKWSK